jgi:hypothetical protein
MTTPGGSPAQAVRGRGGRPPASGQPAWVPPQVFSPAGTYVIPRGDVCIYRFDGADRTLEA